MSSTEAGSSNQLATLIAALHAVPGEGGYYRALVRHTSVLFRESTSGVPGYLFKLRLKTLHVPTATTWHQSLTGVYTSAEVIARIGNSYLRLRIRDAARLTAEEIVSLVEDCVVAHARYFPDIAGYCYDCWRSGSGTLVESGGDVATICPPCFAKQHKKALRRAQRQPGWKLALAGLTARLRGR